MIFVLRYNRQSGTLAEIQEFDDVTSAISISHGLRVQFPQEHWEIVELEADSLDVLKRTHGRYFSTSRELLDELQLMTSNVKSV